MYTSNHHQASAADGMSAYGLSGIELGHRAHARQAAAERDLWLRQVAARSVLNNLRQRLGDVMVRAGTDLAGHRADTTGVPARKDVMMS